MAGGEASSAHELLERIVSMLTRMGRTESFGTRRFAARPGATGYRLGGLNGLLVPASGRRGRPTSLVCQPTASSSFSIGTSRMSGQGHGHDHGDDHDHSSLPCQASPFALENEHSPRRPAASLRLPRD